MCAINGEERRNASVYWRETFCVFFYVGCIEHGRCARSASFAVWVTVPVHVALNAVIARLNRIVSKVESHEHVSEWSSVVNEQNGRVRHDKSVCCYSILSLGC